MKYALIGLLCFLSLSGTTVAQAAQTYQVMLSQNTFAVTLQSNPTTGFQWSVKQYDESLLTLTTSQFIPPSNTHLMGAPGQMMFHFAIKKGAVRPKNTSIQLVYRRPWESKAGTVKRVTIHFVGAN